MDEQLKILKHRSMEDKLEVLTTGIAGLSTPDLFGGHLVGSGFVDSEFLDEVLEVHGDGPRRKVQRLLNAVVTAIKTASSPRVSAEIFDRFVRLIGEKMQLQDLSQHLLDKFAELESNCCNALSQSDTSNFTAELQENSQVEGRLICGEPCQYLTEPQGREAIKHLRSEFTSLVKQTKKHLMDTQADLTDFRDEFILNLPVAVLDQHEKFFSEKSEEISRATCFNSLFFCFNRYWDYLNYNLLEYIIKQLGNKKLIDEMVQYSKEVEEFKQAIQLKVLGEIEPLIIVESPAGFKKIVIEHSITSQSTLSSLDSIHLRVASHFGLQKFALSLAQVVPGSVIATWLMPRSVLDLLLCGLTAELMDELHIISMKIVEDAGKQLSMPAPQGPEIVNAAATGNTARVEELLGNSKENLQATDESGATPLMWAATNGHTDTVENLVAAGAELNTLDKWGCTAVVYTADHGHLDCVKILVEAGADLHIEDKDGWNALIYAGSSGHTDIIQVLEQAGCTWPPLAYAAYHGQIDRAVELFKATGRQEKGSTALVLAAATGNTELVNCLKAAGADVDFTMKSGWTALRWASYNGHTESLKVLLEAGADLNLQDENGVTALMMATYNGHSESLKLLLETGADVNIQAKNGFTALILASQNDHTESLKVLLDAGADVNIQAKNGFTALMLASQNGHTESLKVLLEAGADVNIQAKDSVAAALIMATDNGQVLIEAASDFKIQTKNHGVTALMLASENGRTESLKVLLEAGADFKIQTKSGETALMTASHNGHTDSLKVLLEAGAVFNLQDEDGVTALMMASLNGHSESLKVLLEAGADVNIQTKDGETALMLASKNGHTESLKVLLEAGADFTIQIKDGRTALTIAFQKGHTECVDVLLYRSRS